MDNAYRAYHRTRFQYQVLRRSIARCTRDLSTNGSSRRGAGITIRTLSVPKKLIIRIVGGPYSSQYRSTSTGQRYRDTHRTFHQSQPQHAIYLYGMKQKELSSFVVNFNKNKLQAQFVPGTHLA
eukprot:1495307-Rhodomonas_salina.6